MSTFSDRNVHEVNFWKVNIYNLRCCRLLIEECIVSIMSYYGIVKITEVKNVYTVLSPIQFNNIITEEHIGLCEVIKLCILYSIHESPNAHC